MKKKVYIVSYISWLQIDKTSKIKTQKNVKILQTFNLVMIINLSVEIDFQDFSLIKNSLYFICIYPALIIIIYHIKFKV